MYSENPFATYLFRPNKDQFTRITRVGYVLFTWIEYRGTVRNYYVSST